MLENALRYDTEVRAAIGIARAAGAEIQRIRAEGFSKSRKSDRSLVTEADLASDRQIRGALRERFPDDGIVTEESGTGIAGTTGRTWIVDPLDGTRAFVQGTTDFAVHIGLVEDGRPQVGVVYEPAIDRLYYGIVGVGAFIGAGGTTTIRQVRVSRHGTYADLGFVTSTRMPSERRGEALALGFRDAGCVYSVGCKVGRLVRREADVYFSAHPVSFWDSCAPLVILEAAGGRMTLLDGAPLQFDVASGEYAHPGPFLASNGVCHDALCADFARLHDRWS